MKEDEMGRACSQLGKKRNAYSILVGNSGGRGQLRRPRGRWLDNINIYPRCKRESIGFYGLNWFGSGKGVDEGLSWIFWVTAQLVTSEERLSSMKLVWFSSGGCWDYSHVFYEAKRITLFPRSRLLLLLYPIRPWRYGQFTLMWVLLC
jgi:hypothetical protein